MNSLQAEEKEEAQEEFGWKLVHGDVFRPPPRAMLLSIFVGNGVQLILMALVTLFFACLGFLSPGKLELKSQCLSSFQTPRRAVVISHIFAPLVLCQPLVVVS